jgi:hypothetical protein
MVSYGCCCHIHSDHCRQIISETNSQLKPYQKNTKRNRIFNHILLAIKDISIAVMKARLWGLSPPRGYFSDITIENIQQWLLSHGLVYTCIFSIGYFIYPIIKAYSRLSPFNVKSSGKGRLPNRGSDSRSQDLTEIVIWSTALISVL